MGGKRLGSVDLVLFGQQHTFDFLDEPVDLEIDFQSNDLDDLDDNIAAGREVLRHVESLEVRLVRGAPASARVTVEFEVRYSGSVDVDLDDLEGMSDEDDVRESVERGDFGAVIDAINDDLQNIDDDSVTIDSVEVNLFDEDGNDWES